MVRILNQVDLGSNHLLQIAAGDLTEECADVLVNAANRLLKHGGGVAGAIVQKGGLIIQKESDAWVVNHGPLRHDTPAFTHAGRLHCRFIIHAVGPVWGEGQEAEKLNLALISTLNLAKKLKAKTIAMPPISTGIFGFPKEIAARIFFNTIRNYWLSYPDSLLKVVRITIIDGLTQSIFQNIFANWKNEIEAGKYAGT